MLLSAARVVNDLDVRTDRFCGQKFSFVLQRPNSEAALSLFQVTYKTLTVVMGTCMRGAHPTGGSLRSSPANLFDT